MRDVQDKLRELCRTGAEALGFEMVDVELVSGGRSPTLRVYIDSPQGITADDCADVSRQLSAIFDVEDPLPGSYILEVSSPGLDRPLTGPADYRKRVGETVKLKLRRPDETGRRNFTGVLVEATEEQIVVEVDKERFRVPYTAIERARLVPKF
jgi:ribosome maturation factor RimP